MIVSFGQYKGKDHTELPLDYLQYVVSNFRENIFKQACQQELQRRKGQSVTIKLSRIEFAERLNALLELLPGEETPGYTCRLRTPKYLVVIEKL